MTYRQKQFTHYPKREELPRIETFYTPDGKYLRPALLDEEARMLGGAFSEGGACPVSSAQIRRFYNDMKQLQQKIENDLNERGIPFDSTDPADLQKHLALVKMFKAKLAYAMRGGAAGKVSPEFKATMDECIKLIETPRDFEAFALFFEAILGYYKEKGG